MRSLERRETGSSSWLTIWLTPIPCECSQKSERCYRGFVWVRLDCDGKKLLGIIEKVVSTNRTSLAMLLPSLGNWLITGTLDHSLYSSSPFAALSSISLNLLRTELALHSFFAWCLSDETGSLCYRNFSLNGHNKLFMITHLWFLFNIATFFKERKFLR